MKKGTGRLLILITYISIVGTPFLIAQDLGDTVTNKKELFCKKEIIGEEKALIWFDVFEPSGKHNELWLYEEFSMDINAPAIIPKEYIAERLNAHGISDFSVSGGPAYFIPIDSENKGQEEFLFKVLKFIDENRTILEITEKEDVDPLIIVDIFPMPERQIDAVDFVEHITVHVLSVKKDIDGKRKAIMEVRSPSEGLTSRFIATLEVFRPYLVAKKTLERGEAISLSKVTQSFIDKTAVWGEPLTPSDLSVVVTANKKIAPGTVITSAHSTKEKMVRAGSDVIIYHSKGGIQVRLFGRAYESGAMGERIKVKPKNAKRYVKGQIIGKGEVMVYVP